MWQYSRNVWPLVVYSVSFLIGHATPEDSEVALEIVELEIGVETFEEVGIVELLLPLGAPDGDAVGTFVGNPDIGVVELPLPLGATEGGAVGTFVGNPGVGVVRLPVPLGVPDGIPVVIFEETPDVGIVELPVPLGAIDGELRIIGPDRAGSLVMISGKVVLVVGLDDPLEVLAVGLEVTAVAFEGVEEPEEGIVELTDGIGAIDGGLEMVRPDCGDPLVGISDEMLTVDVVRLNDPLGALEVELELSVVAIKGVELEEALEAGAVVFTETKGLEESAVPEVVGELEEPLEVDWGDVRTTLLKDEGIVAVLFGDNRMVVLVGMAPLEADIVRAFTSEGSRPGVIVRMSKSVARAVSSL